MRQYGESDTGGSKKRTITALFARYVCIYTAGALFWLFIIGAVYFICDVTGEVLPANHMEVQLNAAADEIQNAPEITEELLPDGCAYGVYADDGTWKYGTFSSEEKKEAWEHYEMNHIYASGREYYRFFVREEEEICIVEYEIATRFRNQLLGKFLPGPDMLAVFSFVVLFLVHTILVSRHFGKYMRKRLNILNEMTTKIRNQDLEFGEEHSELKEVDEVLMSLYQMKEALKDSLYQQWNLEKSKEEQIAALAHDIKTPLTIIRGNAELLAEGELGEEEKDYNQDVLISVSTIEEYLQMLNEILMDSIQKNDIRKNGIFIDEFVDNLKERCRILAVVSHCQIYFRENDLYREELYQIFCNESQILRAFDNILSNAVDYSPQGGKIEVQAEIVKEQGRNYLAVVVTDEGPGFTKEGLKYATEQFYQGDKSRNSKNHYGIGLCTAERFAREQGGYLAVGNAGIKGAKVTLFIVLYQHKNE